MKYLEIQFNIPSKEDYIKDLLAAQLAEIGFESFSDENGQYRAYIQEPLFDESSLQTLLDQFEFQQGITFLTTEAEDKDWNEEWEKNCFEPIIIGNQCVIHATSHKEYPKAKYDISINPKMSFGSGHHSTTSLMIRTILSSDFTDKSLLDMGCGTAILAILASLRGANPITAIDIDEWAYNNAIENIQLNHINNIDVKCGGATLLGDQTFDIILANINRNILLNDIHAYASVLNRNGLLVLSGFYESDIEIIEQECNRNGLKQISYEKDNNWVAVRFCKE